MNNELAIESNSIFHRFYDSTTAFLSLARGMNEQKNIQKKKKIHSNREKKNQEISHGKLKTRFVMDGTRHHAEIERGAASSLKRGYNELFLNRKKCTSSRELPE